jgi:hypothetical protein
MKFRCGLTRKKWYDKVTHWHRWFAWRPVKVGNCDCRWLEYVERKINWDKYYDGTETEYRPLQLS